MPAELYTVLGTGLGSLAVIGFYFGRHYAEIRERHNSKNLIEDLQEIRFEIRAREVMPILDKLYQFLNATFVLNPNYLGAEDILLSTSYGPKLNDLVNELESPLISDVRVKEDWQRILVHYGRLSYLCFMLSFLGVVGFPLLASSLVFGNLYSSELLTLGFVFVTAILGSVLVVGVEILSSRCARGKYQEAKSKYLVDKLRR